MTDLRPPEYPTGPPSWPPGWHPDPAGRHQYRLWDGTRWTEQVSDGGVASWDPMPSQVATTTGRRGRARKSRRKVWIGLGVLLLLAVIGAAVLAYLVSQVDGAGTFARELEEPGSTLVHTVNADEDTVLLIRVAPGNGSFDPVIAVATDGDAIDRLADFFDTDGALPEDEFPGVVPEDNELLAVADAAEAGDDEFTFVATPFGGDFEILVTGAGDSVGPFELEITVQPFDGPDDGQAYVEELAGQDFIEDFEPPRSPIEDILDDFIDEGD